LDREYRRNTAGEFSGRRDSSGELRRGTRRTGTDRTDCYIGLSRICRGQSDAAAGNAHVQSDAARQRRLERRWAVRFFANPSP
jgi:hypothetical protein